MIIRQDILIKEHLVPKLMSYFAEAMIEEVRKEKKMSDLPAQKKTFILNKKNKYKTRIYQTSGKYSLLLTTLTFKYKFFHDFCYNK